MNRSPKAATSINLVDTAAQYRDGHFAVMPDMVAEICIRAGCPIGGTVLDPFSGAGTQRWSPIDWGAIASESNSIGPSSR